MKKWVFYKAILYFAICLYCNACNNNSTVEAKPFSICGKWKINGLQKVNDTLNALPNNSLYTLELLADSSFTIQIEDNQIRGSFHTNKPSELKLSSITTTDVCCNSLTGQLVQQAFSSSSFQYECMNDTLFVLKSENEIMRLSSLRKY